MQNINPDFIYGPIKSRSLGNSLGVNLFPDRKTCNFDCIYCQCTLSKNILANIMKKGNNDKSFEYITFSGDGEPTCSNLFSAAAETVYNIRNTYLPDVKLALFSNGSFYISDKDISKQLAYFDKVVIKLDAVAEKQWNVIYRTNIDFNLRCFTEAVKSLPHLCVRTMLFNAPGIDDARKHIKDFAEVYKELNPEEIQIVTVDRKPKESEVLPVQVKDIIRFQQELRNILNNNLQINAYSKNGILEQRDA